MRRGDRADQSGRDDHVADPVVAQEEHAMRAFMPAGEPRFGRRAPMHEPGDRVDDVSPEGALCRLDRLHRVSAVVVTVTPASSADRSVARTSRAGPTAKSVSVGAQGAGPYA